jgi:hypothetical protein
VLEPETMYFPTSSAVLLWMWEIKGQLSDGMWENTRPFNHCSFWFNLKVKVGPSAVNSTNYCVKKTYNIGGLKQHVGGRMLKFAKFGKANNVNHIEMGSEVRCIVEEFPAQGPFNLEEFKANMIKSSNWRSAEYYWKGLTQEMVDNYYKVKYTEIDLNNDIRYIKDTLLKAKGGNHLR